MPFGPIFCADDGLQLHLGANKTVTSTGGGGIGTATVTLEDDGDWRGLTSIPGNPPTVVEVFAEKWLTPAVAGMAARYGVEARATLNSGSTNVGSSPTGEWLALTSSRVWSKTGAGSASLTIEIRRAGHVFDSCDVTLTGS